MLMLVSVLIVVFLAYANGANDNFKGVATLYGSGTASFKGALSWATVTTALGSLTALFLAQGLVAAFSGKGLVPDSVASMPSYSLAVVLGAAATVMLATRFGFPISTTHALTGGLVGAGLLASPSGVDWSKLGSNFFLPLLVSPVLAVVLAGGCYLIFQRVRARLGVSRGTCVCVGAKDVAVVPAGGAMAGAGAVFSTQIELAADAGGTAACTERYAGNMVGVEAGPVLDRLHYLSAGIVCFARALNDTPKIAAIMLAAGALSPGVGITLVAVAMGIGGLVNSRRVAETMAHKVTAMNPEQGLTANLVTGALVIGASKIGLPVSTTHVSVGALFGIGTVTRQAKVKMIAGILLAWMTTLPVAAGLSAVVFYALQGVAG